MKNFNEIWRISPFRRFLLWFSLPAGGALYAAALPPFNLEFLGFVCIVPLLYASAKLSWRKMLFAGWLWGVGWAVFAYQFLREIEPPVPYLLAPVMGLWPMLFAGCLPFLRRNLLYPASIRLKEFEEREAWSCTKLPWWRFLWFGITAAALYTCIEWTRSRLFVWNDLSVTQYRNINFIQIAALTGSYGVTFLVALGNSAVYALLFRRGRIAGAILALILGLNFIRGYFCTARFILQCKDASVWHPALIQGDLSQRRHSGEKEFREAMEIYLRLTREAAKLKPDTILWPECAVPVPLRSAHSWAREFAREIVILQSETQIPLLMGSLDFSSVVPLKGTVPGVTNSALFLDKDAHLIGKYDKIHRVPYGEYVPFRRFIPEFIVERIDMGRDLTPGSNWNPLAIGNGVRAGIAICYEGVFGYLTREFARRGANVLIDLANDAWYPRSSEPEQHLANSVMRCIETGLPMVRCGNNGGSGIILPTGALSQYLDVSGVPGKRVEIKRGRAFGKIGVFYLSNPPQTFYVRYGEWLILLLWIEFFGSFVFAFENCRRYYKKLPPEILKIVFCCF